MRQKLLLLAFVPALAAGGCGARMAHRDQHAVASARSSHFTRALVTKWSGVAGGRNEQFILDAEQADQLAELFPALGQPDQAAIAAPPRFIIVFERSAGATVEARLYSEDGEAAEFLSAALDASRR
jgi:hypothetical protein